MKIFPDEKQSIKRAYFNEYGGAIMTAKWFPLIIFMCGQFYFYSLTSFEMIFDMPWQ